MQYLLILYVDEGGFASLSPAEAEKGMAAYTAYTEALEKAGALVAGKRLKPSATASTVRVAQGKAQVLNGPYADSKEQIGGYYLIDVPNDDAARKWAERCPASGHGVVEVRALWA